MSFVVTSRLADLVGGVPIIGLGVFVAASAAAALSGSAAALIAARLVQGASPGLRAPPMAGRHLQIKRASLTEAALVDTASAEDR